MVRGGRDHCGTRIPSFYGGDDDGDDVDVDDVDKDYIGDQGVYTNMYRKQLGFCSNRPGWDKLKKNSETH